MSLRSDNLSGFDVDEDVLLALLRRWDLDHVDILAALFLDRDVGDFAGDALKRNLRRLFFRDLCRGRARAFEGLRLAGTTATARATRSTLASRPQWIVLFMAVSFPFNRTPERNTEGSP